MITDEQPPESTDTELSEYLSRMFRNAKIEDANKDQPIRYSSIPEKLGIGKRYYFLNAIPADPVITTEGLYLYKSTGWVFLG